MSHHCSYLSYITVSQRFWLSAHWTQMLPSSSSFYLQSIQQKFVAPLCSSDLQEKEAVLTWKRREEQQEQKCCQLPFRERDCQARAVHGMVRVGSHSCHQHSSCCGRKEGMEHCGCQGSIPAALAAPHQPSYGWAVLHSCSSECLLGMHRALL